MYKVICWNIICISNILTSKYPVVSTAVLEMGMISGVLHDEHQNIILNQKDIKKGKRKIQCKIK